MYSLITLSTRPLSNLSSKEKRKRLLGGKWLWGMKWYLCSTRVIAAVDFTQTTNLVSFVKSRMHFSILHQTKPLRAHSHFPLSQLQMSPLACLQWALCCLPVMACEISIIIIMAPRAAMSADGRSLIGNELCHHPKGRGLLLCYSEVCSMAFTVWHLTVWHVSVFLDEADLRNGS